jgi:hypothetical protein
METSFLAGGLSFLAKLKHSTSPLSGYDINSISLALFLSPNFPPFPTFFPFSSFLHAAKVYLKLA